MRSSAYDGIALVPLEDYIVGIFYLSVGGIICANVIGCFCSTQSKAHHVEERFEEHTDMRNTFMRIPAYPNPKPLHTSFISLLYSISGAAFHVGL